MSDAGLRIVIGADVKVAVAGVQQLEGTLADAEKELTRLGLAIDHAIDSGKDISKLEDAFQKVSDRVKQLRAEVAQPITPPPSPAIPVPDDKGFLNTIGKQKLAFLDLGRVVTGQGFNLRSLAANFSLLGPGVTIAAAAIYGLVELFGKQSDAEKKATEDAKKLKEELINLKSATEITETSTGSEAGNIARVRALAAAIQDTNKTYKERKNALNELRETNKAYFGDLTLEANSLATLSARVHDYANALITEAIVKGQVEEIAKVSSELQKQKKVLDTVREAFDKANAAQAAGPADNIAGGGTGAVGGGGNISDAARLESNVKKATDALAKQKEAVFALEDQVIDYRRELDKAIDEQIKQKPLKDPTPQKDALKSIIPILEQIKKIYDDIAKPNKEPLFKQLADSTNVNDIKLIQAQIAEAIHKGVTDGAKNPAIRQAYGDLVTALQAKLNHLQNPNLVSRIRGIVDVKADDLQLVESKIEKAFGTKGLELKIPVHLSQLIENTGAFGSDDVKKIKDELQKDVGFSKLFEVAVPEVQISIGRFLIHEADIKNLKKVIEDVGSSVVLSGFSDIGKSLGDALSGSKNPLQAAIKDFTSVLGDGLIKIGEKMIEASTLMATIKAALHTLFENPIGGVVAGIAAVALGEIVKNVGQHAFADGGIVTGPTNALIGEAGPEVVFPLNQLNRFIQRTNGNGTQNINVTGSISGNNIRLAMARSNKQQGLV